MTGKSIVFGILGAVVFAAVASASPVGERSDGSRTEASACSFGTCKDKPGFTCFLSVGPYLVVQDDACDTESSGC